ncbi:MAG: cyanophycin synthetase [Patescibacteria group bacterium]
MLTTLKKSLYFPLSYYFRFFAKIKLNSWKPYIIVVTGSSGKTSLLHLLESQIGDKAKYSHHANSTYGIPFDILGLKRKNLKLTEWAYLFLAAPFSIFKPVPKHTIYIVEADCDRPQEGRYLATLLKPEITLWTSSTKTHSMNFDQLVKNGRFENVEEAIAFEFGYFLEYSRELAVVNDDSPNIEKQLLRTKVRIIPISINDLTDYRVSIDQTILKIGNEEYRFDKLLPKEIYHSLQMCLEVLKYLKLPLDKSFKNFTLPPGRNSVFKGIKNTTIIDSAYNANLDSMTAVLNMFENIKAEKKWMVLGDMLEQGESEQKEHEKLADEILKIKSDKIILMGPRVSKFTLPKLKSEDKSIISFENPKDVLEYLKENLKGGELLLFKGARFLEGVIENLLADKKDADKLARREKIWQKRRSKFGL